MIKIICGCCGKEDYFIEKDDVLYFPIEWHVEMKPLQLPNFRDAEYLDYSPVISPVIHVTVPTIPWVTDIRILDSFTILCPNCWAIKDIIE
jgi:hypothetical protein